MKKATINALKNRAKKQQKAFCELSDARKRGALAVLDTLLHGNQYVRNVVTGKHLAEGVSQFILTPEEQAALAEHKRQEDAEFFEGVRMHKELIRNLSLALVQEFYQEGL